jgi:hypothetical protein
MSRAPGRGYLGGSSTGGRALPSAHGIAQKNSDEKATTEDLRQAIKHYRALFEELLEPAATSAPTGADPGERSGNEGEADTAGSQAATPATESLGEADAGEPAIGPFSTACFLSR